MGNSVARTVVVFFRGGPRFFLRGRFSRERRWKSLGSLAISGIVWTAKRNGMMAKYIVQLSSADTSRQFNGKRVSNGGWQRVCFRFQIYIRRNNGVAQLPALLTRPYVF